MTVGKYLTTALFALYLMFCLPVLAANEWWDDAMAVANRGSGDLSLINTRTLDVQNIDLEYEGEAAEPMYVNHWRSQYADWGQIFIGDRKNNRILAVDDRGHDVVYAIPVGRGVFHQSVQRNGKQLWVVNDIDKTLSVINPDWWSVVETIHIPAEYDEGKPHDVFLTEQYAYVTVIGLSGGNRLLRYNLDDYSLSKRINIAGGAHVFAQSGKVYIASESDEQLRVYREYDLKLRRTPEVPNAHGLVTSENARHVYVTNIAEGGDNAIWALSKNGRRSFGSGDTWYDTPHNLALDSDDKQLFVTHSGENDKVTVLKTRRRKSPIAIDSVTVGNNPFGLGLVTNTFPRH
ncbi:MAG: YncE family protein [Thiolinea sp.]